MRGTTRATLTALTLGAALTSPLALAATASLTGTVTRVLVMGTTTYGGCMAKLSVDPATVLPLCTAGWVTFSCSGDFTEPVRAYRMLDQAQLALAAGKKVFVTVTDASQHNGYCLATRIDVIN